MILTLLLSSGGGLTFPGVWKPCGTVRVGIGCFGGGGGGGGGSGANGVGLLGDRDLTDARSAASPSNLRPCIQTGEACIPLICVIIQIIMIKPLREHKRRLPPKLTMPNAIAQTSVANT